MSTAEIVGLGGKIEALTTRVGDLEKAITALMARTLRHDKVLRWLKTLGLVLLGAAVGSGMVQINDVVGLMGTP